MKKLYHIYDPENSNRVTALLSETILEFSINHSVNGEFDPAFDIENDCIIDLKIFTQEEKECLCSQELAELKKENDLVIDDLVYTHVQRLVMDKIEIPQYIIDKKEELKSSYHIQKQAILRKYGLTINP